MIDITLTKEKYKTTKHPYKAGTYKNRTGNCHGKTPKRAKGAQGNGHRRRQGLGATGVM